MSFATLLRRAPTLVFILLLLRRDVIHAIAENSQYLGAVVFSFPSSSPKGSGGEPCFPPEEATPIGGEPACFSIANKHELYLCDTHGHVLISDCEKEDCTRCDVPALNQYGYVDGRCQQNGWLVANCTDAFVVSSRFLTEEERSSNSL